MKNLLILLTILLLGSCQQKKLQIKQNSINPIIGDISYVEKFGSLPNELSNEHTRIKTHLNYVEKLLREKSISHLSVVERKNRTRLLDYLRNYHVAGIFPKNYDHEDERRPCFIDKDKNICAVGYLVAQTAGLETAEEINSQYKYAAIGDMNSDLLEDWIGTTGLSRNEIAMIQPNYGGPIPVTVNQSYVGEKLAIPSAMLNAANIGISAASVLDWNKNKNSKNVARLGILSGILTLGYTAYDFYSSDYQFSGRTKGQRRVHSANLILGVASIGINAIKLKRDKRRNSKALSWNINMQPGINDQPIIGFAINKKL